MRRQGTADALKGAMKTLNLHPPMIFLEVRSLARRAGWSCPLHARGRFAPARGAVKARSGHRPMAFAGGRTRKGVGGGDRVMR